MPLTSANLLTFNTLSFLKNGVLATAVNKLSFSKKYSFAEAFELPTLINITNRNIGDKRIGLLLGFQDKECLVGSIHNNKIIAVLKSF